MKKKIIFPLLSILILCCSITKAQTIDAKAIRLMQNGQEITKPSAEDTVSVAGELIGSAPMKVLFKANVDAPEGYTYFCEWSSSAGGNSTPALFRTEEEWEFTFDQSGAYYYSLLVTFTDKDGNTIDETAGDFVIRISESELKVPNAFSPNGDGINDVFKVTYKSLVKFNAYVFNRWGQELYHWGLNKIDEGWDGTAHGKPVKDGVYFIVVEAEGSDGIKYKHKGDINILKGYSGTGTTGTGNATE